MGAWRYVTNCVTGRRVWHWYPRVAAPERPVWWPCAKAGALAIPLAIGPAVFFPAAAPPPPVIIAPVPMLPPVLSPGSAGQGFYIPPREGSEFSPYVPAGETSPILTGFSPPPGGTTTAPLVPPSIPPTTVGSVPPPPTAVPEPASLALLAVGAGGAVLVRRRRG